MLQAATSGGLGQVAGLILAVCTGGGVTAIVQWLAGRRKTGAEVVRVYTDTALQLLDPLRQEIERLEGRVRTAHEQLTIAGALLRQHGIEWPPGNTPPPWV